jgi:hypothetical protein
MAAHSGSRSAGTQVVAALVVSEKTRYVAYALRTMRTFPCRSPMPASSVWSNGIRPPRC